MASIVLGIGSARSPLTSLPPERWPELAERDKSSTVLFELDGSPVSYETLLDRAPDLSAQLDPALWQRQYETAQRDFDVINETIQRAAPDVLVIMGDDEEELHHSDNRP